MIGYTLAELRRLLNSLAIARAPDTDGVWPWSGWRRRRQYQARICHCRRRGYVLTWRRSGPGFGEARFPWSRWSLRLAR